MSNYTNQNRDFVVRTKELLEQYKKSQIPSEKKYEVTLLLNCCVGLLMLPRTECYEHFPDESVSEKDWGIDPENISIIEGNKKTVPEVARHIRNSVAHYRFVANDDSNTISSIKFEDIDTRNNNEKTFEATIPVNCLRTFLYKTADIITEKLKGNGQ
jgi:hypothetical protein